MKTPEARELRQIRLDRDLSYNALAKDISVVTGLTISERTVYRVLNDDDFRLRERTLHRLRQYLAALKRVAASAPAVR